MRSLLLVLVLLAGSSNVAFARDHLELVCAAEGKRVRFRGTYTLVGSGDSYTLTLRGQLTDDPSARKITYREVVVDLPCVDLSY